MIMIRYGMSRAHLVIFVLSFVVSTSQKMNAQVDTTLRDFFPMHIGDRWQYIVDWYPDYPRVYVEIIGDTIMPNGQSYYQFEVVGDDFPRIDLYRWDDSLRVIKYWPDSISCAGSELVTYDLRLPDGGIWPTCMHGESMCDPPYIGLAFTQFGRFYPELNLFADTKMFCEAQIDTVQGDTSFCPLTTCINYIPRRLARGLGLVWSQFEGPARDLEGAIINGIRYGTIVGVREWDVSMGHGVKLLENYPNPFNSSSTIRFYLPNSGLVVLKVYDLLGREISTLVNGHQPPGEHRVSFTPNDLPSGVYYYRLNVNSQFPIPKGSILTKKFIYLK